MWGHDGRLDSVEDLEDDSLLMVAVARSLLSRARGPTINGQAARICHANEAENAKEDV
jgi:hypothetical protein